MHTNPLFSPLLGGTQSATMTGTAVPLTFTPKQTAAGPTSGLMICNSGAKPAFARVGVVGGTIATVADCPILAGDKAFIPLDGLLIQSGFDVSLFGTASDVIYVTPVSFS